MKEKSRGLVYFPCQDRGRHGQRGRSAPSSAPPSPHEVSSSSPFLISSSLPFSFFLFFSQDRPIIHCSLLKLTIWIQFTSTNLTLWLIPQIKSLFGARLEPGLVLSLVLSQPLCGATWCGLSLQFLSQPKTLILRLAFPETRPVSWPRISTSFQLLFMSIERPSWVSVKSWKIYQKLRSQRLMRLYPWSSMHSVIVLIVR